MSSPTTAAHRELSRTGSDPRSEMVDEPKAAVDRDHAHLETMSMPSSIRDMTEDERGAIIRKMVRKMDTVIMPIIALLYILNYVDRQNLAAAKLQGILTDLHLSTTQFATAISILFVGYIPFQVPSNLLISRVPRPGLYICCAVILWGSVSACTAAVKTYGQLIAVRILLGMTEAVFFPGVIYFLSAWYTKQELGKRLAGLFIGQQLGNAFGGLIAAGVLKLNGVNGIAGWRYLFIVEGVATIGVGAISALLMPEYPHNARLLSPIERDLAVWRIESEGGVGEAHEEISTWRGFYLVMTDPKLYLLVFCMILSQGLGSISNWFPSIVQTLGYNSTDTLLLTAPPYLFACIWFYVMTLYSDRKDEMYTPIMFCNGVMVVALVIPLATLNTGARYFAMMLMPSAAVGPQVILYKTLNLHLARPYPKRAAGTALLNAIGGTSNIWASYMYINPPHYYIAFGTLLAIDVVFAVVITVYKVWVGRENRKLDQGGDKAKETMKGGVTQQQIDLGWRYVGY
ncbi:hypothetical protein EHS25_005976 [Saitozyma podzolica]|uniref:Major facilitator superfamily (MFS) profile domain-containing protein n=1 Tax=Saitozyma podzolica TaxID=1890683 RepID=A0A427XTL8_9TREE|nr:hypothetical protein EHS25_005976 [Saitozyma podzolica]